MQSHLNRRCTATCSLTRIGDVGSQFDSPISKTFGSPQEQESPLQALSCTENRWIDNAAGEGLSPNSSHKLCADVFRHGFVVLRTVKALVVTVIQLYRGSSLPHSSLPGCRLSVIGRTLVAAILRRANGKRVIYSAAFQQ